MTTDEDEMGMGNANKKKIRKCDKHIFVRVRRSDKKECVTEDRTEWFFRCIFISFHFSTLFSKS